MDDEVSNYSELLKSSEFTNMVNTHIAQFITITETEGTILWMNNIPSGYTLQDLIGKKNSDFLIEPYKSNVKQNYEWVIKNQQPIHSQFVSITGRHYNQTLVPFKFKENQYIIIFAFEITEITKTEEYHKLAIDSSPIGFAITRNNTIIKANHTYARILERSLDEVIGKNTLDIITPLSVDKINKMSVKRRKGEDVPTTYLIDVIKGNGEYKTVKQTVTVSTYEGESVIFSYIQDISENLDIQEDRELLIQQYNLILDKSPYGIMIVDRNQIIKYLNEKMLELLGGSKQDYVETPALHIIHENARDKIQRFTQDRLAGVEDQSIVPKEYEIDLITKEGKILPTINRVQLTEFNGEKTFINYFKDNREIKRMEQERTKMQAMIEQTSRLEEIGTMAAGLAHDFNNLLMGIEGTTNLMALEIEDNDIQKDLKSIQEASNEAKNIIKQMLDLSGKSNAEPEIFDLCQVIREIDTLINPLVDDNIEIEAMLSEDSLFIKINKTQLKQIIVNIVSNANRILLDRAYGRIEIKTGRERVSNTKTKTSLTLGKIQYENYVYLKITNNGPQIEEHTLNLIFDPFYSMSTGRGLGLSVVLGIVRQHDGFLSVDTNEDETSFTFFFPEINVAEHTVRKEVDAIPSDLRVDKLSVSLNILIVDDNSTVLNVTTRMLEKLDHTVYSASRRDNALELIENFQFDVIITDLSMPDMPFNSFYTQLMDVENFKSKILLISGYSEENVGDYLNNDDISFLHKPYAIQDLEDALNSGFTVNDF